MQSHAYKECSSVGGLVTPVTRDALGKLVVASETVDARLNKNETELGVLVLAVLFQMLTHGDGLLDEAVQVLWEGWCETLATQVRTILLPATILTWGIPW